MQTPLICQPPNFHRFCKFTNHAISKCFAINLGYTHYRNMLYNFRLPCKWFRHANLIEEPRGDMFSMFGMWVLLSSCYQWTVTCLPLHCNRVLSLRINPLLLLLLHVLKKSWNCFWENLNFFFFFCKNFYLFFFYFLCCNISAAKSPIWLLLKF